MSKNNFQHHPETIAKHVESYNWTVSPEEHCLSMFNNDLNFNDLETHWVGFDKYKKLIYGVQRMPFSDRLPQFLNRRCFSLPVNVIPPEILARLNQLQSGAETELDDRRCIVAQSIFGGRPFVISSFELPELREDNEGGSWMDTRMEHYSISDEHIAFYGDYTQKRKFIYMFSLQVGSIAKYNLTSEIGRIKQMIHVSTLGWLGLIYVGPTEGRQELKLYRFIFDHNELNVDVAFLAEIPKTQRGLYTFSREKFCVFEETFDFVNVFDFREQLWSRKFVDEAPVGHAVITCSEDGQHLILARSDYDKKALPRLYSYTVYKLIGDVWKSSDVSFITAQTLSKSDYQFISTDGIIFVHPDLNEPGIFLSRNLLSLKEVALRKFLKSCTLEGSALKHYLDNLHLSDDVKRRYFGPNWGVKYTVPRNSRGQIFKISAPKKIFKM